MTKGSPEARILSMPAPMSAFPYLAAGTRAVRQWAPGPYPFRDSHHRRLLPFNATSEGGQSSALSPGVCRRPARSPCGRPGGRSDISLRMMMFLCKYASFSIGGISRARAGKDRGEISGFFLRSRFHSECSGARCRRSSPFWARGPRCGSARPGRRNRPWRCRRGPGPKGS